MQPPSYFPPSLAVRLPAEAHDFRFNHARNAALRHLVRRICPCGSIARAEDLRPVAWRDLDSDAQFRRDNMSIDAQVRQVRRKLGDRVDAWETASWLVCPNELLDGRCPLDVVGRDAAAARQAARAHRAIDRDCRCSGSGTRPAQAGRTLSFVSLTGATLATSTTFSPATSPSMGTSLRRLNAVDWVALVLLIVGGLNWGLIGGFSFDLVAAIFGTMTVLSRIVYGLVGVSALYTIYLLTVLRR